MGVVASWSGETHPHCQVGRGMRQIAGGVGTSASAPRCGIWARRASEGAGSRHCVPGLPIGMQDAQHWASARRGRKCARFAMEARIALSGRLEFLESAAARRRAHRLRRAGDRLCSASSASAHAREPQNFITAVAIASCLCNGAASSQTLAAMQLSGPPVCIGRLGVSQDGPCQLHGSWLPIVRAETQRQGGATLNFSRP